MVHGNVRRVHTLGHERRAKALSTVSFVAVKRIDMVTPRPSGPSYVMLMVMQQQWPDGYRLMWAPVEAE